MARDVFHRAVSNQRKDIEFIRGLSAQKIGRIYYSLAALMHHPDFSNPQNQLAILGGLSRLNKILREKLSGNQLLTVESEEFRERLKRLEQQMRTSNGRKRNKRNGGRRQF